MRRSRIERTYESKDGTLGILMRLDDGRVIESVRIPDGTRNTLCISSQVGCAVACRFCASGLDGVERNLSVEIVELLPDALLLEVDGAAVVGPVGILRRIADPVRVRHDELEGDLVGGLQAHRRRRGAFFGRRRGADAGRGEAGDPGQEAEAPFGPPGDLSLNHGGRRCGAWPGTPRAPPPGSPPVRWL